MIVRMMYVLPMILGRTYDMKKNTVGLDIFPLEATQKPQITNENFYNSNFKTVETSSDVNDVLQITGDLSLNIKSGMFAVRGVGSYISDSLKAQKSVDILTKVSFRTVSKSLPHSARPVKTWSTLGKKHLGTHFVQSILYGGDLIACVRFKAVKSEYLQDIRATVKASLEGGSALDLVGEGKLETLDKKLENKASMEINYFATVPLEGVPNTIEGLRELVRNFEKHVTKVNNGLGVPVEVELAELSTIDTGFAFLKNQALKTELQFFEEYLDDLLSTKSRLKSWIETIPEALSSSYVKEISDFSERISKILRKFIEIIASLNYESGPEQLDGAKEAYKEGKGLGMAGKFRRELNKLMKKIVIPNFDPENRISSVYVHYGSSECTTDELTSVVYSGYLSSSPRNITGGGYNYLCLPKSPESYKDEPYTSNGNESSIAGVKYGLLENQPFVVNKDDIVLRGVVCAVCLVKQKSTVVTFHGQTKCPEKGGWNHQYLGYLYSANDVNRSETICVDSKQGSHQDSYMSLHDHSLALILLCKNEELLYVPCVVCAK